MHDFIRLDEECSNRSEQVMGKSGSKNNNNNKKNPCVGWHFHVISNALLVAIKHTPLMCLKYYHQGQNHLLITQLFVPTVTKEAG